MLAGIYDPRERPAGPGVAGRLRRCIRRGRGEPGSVRRPARGRLRPPRGRRSRRLRAGRHVYNRPELAEQLDEDPGLSDEGLLARAHQRWGETMLTRLRGAFALVAWSAGGGTVLFAQDQVGIGALFLHRSGEELVFASEIHHLLALLPRTPGPNEIALVRWLATADLGDGLTMFDGVRRLGAGRRLTIAGVGIPRTGTGPRRTRRRSRARDSRSPPVEGRARAVPSGCARAGSDRSESRSAAGSTPRRWPRSRRR